ncbi:hypothetical protein TorRG33x02_147140 [Trema orientale]|uniref:Uncharacterized protein n=1 Tax=Trema orientale TaxID=63057 RepID=A0A2P5EVK4_TREOI|nr:hypothetical protein TorRG33x02_147140 [Trema orientale]
MEENKAPPPFKPRALFQNRTWEIRMRDRALASSFEENDDRSG